MRQQDHDKSFTTENRTPSLAFAVSKPALNKAYAHVKSCKHRDENGWCSKSQQQCALLNFIFTKH